MKLPLCLRVKSEIVSLTTVICYVNLFNKMFTLKSKRHKSGRIHVKNGKLNVTIRCKCNKRIQRKTMKKWKLPVGSVSFTALVRESS